MTVGDLLNKAIELLRSPQTPASSSAKLDAELLISAALGWKKQELYTKSKQELGKDELAKCITWLERRQGGEPVAYILGVKGFYNHDFLVSPDVLIPRPETELIVELALEWLHSNSETPTLRIVDLGAGSGCIGLSLAAEIPEIQLLTVDNSAAALEILMNNAARLGVVERIRVWNGDAGALNQNIVREILGGPADLVVANPPYVAFSDPELDDHVKKFEPPTALFAGPDGLEAIRAWATASQTFLRPDGYCVFEIGSRQGPAAKEIFSSLTGFDGTTIHKDLAQLDRAITAWRTSHG